MTGFKRIKQLDGIRFIALSLVLVAHWIQPHISIKWFQSIPFVHGVTLFFVLSGFLITSGLLNQKSRGISAKKQLIVFYQRRFLRIFPPYYLLIVLLLIFNVEQSRDLWAWLLTYTINIYQSLTNESIGHLNHLWSLAVEEQFYLFWPIILIFAPKFSIKWKIVFTIILSLFTKALLFLFYGKWMATAYFTISCMHALGLGALLAYFNIHKPSALSWLNKTVIWLGGLFLYGLTIGLKWNENHPFYKEVFDEFLFSLVSIPWVWKASKSQFKGGIKWMLEHKVVNYLGQISYGMYLFHLIVPYLVQQMEVFFGFEVHSSITKLTIYFSLTFLYSITSWYLLEKPLMRYKLSYLTSPK